MTDPRPLAAFRTAPALAADPRPGTRPLTESALGVLHIELLHVAADRVVARMPLAATTPRSTLLVLAESAASTAAGFAVGSDRRAFGAELDANFVHAFAAATGPALAEATPLVLDEHRHTWRVTVVDAAGRQLLEARCSLGIVDAPTA